MFNAVIEGRKSQTRRIIKTDGNIAEFPLNDGGSLYDRNTGYFIKSLNPRYKVGETVFIKEPYFLKWYDKKNYDVWYKYTDADALIENCKLWKNKLFMPAKYARYFIEIVSVKCERLQDISDEDCLKEGVERWNGFFHTNIFDKKNKRLLVHKTPQEAYAALIDSINGKGTWKSNPYVWVYEFKLVNNKITNE